MRRDVRAILRDAGVTAVFVTHDQEEALSIADRVAVMRAGRILQCDRQSVLYARPAHAFVASFVGDADLIRCSGLGARGHVVGERDPGGARRRVAVGGVVGPLAVAWLVADVLSGHMTLIVDFERATNPPYRGWRSAAVRSPLVLDAQFPRDPVRAVPFSVIIIGLGLALVLAACGGGDDGVGVRTIGDDASASGSASATGSASGSATGSATGTASAAARCKPVGDIADATTQVAVRLDERVIVPNPRSVPAGRVGFVVENVGKEPHELVIIKGVAPGALPTHRHGALDESRLPAGALVGEIEAFPAGESCDGVFALTPGEYTLVCNLTEKEDKRVESHLGEGMVTTLSVW
jgi:hypothetical protein